MGSLLCRDVEAAAEVEEVGALKNAAFMFVKPHAMTQGVKDLVAAKLRENNIAVVRSGTIDAHTIDKDGLIDTHYGAIASRAVRQRPSELLVQPSAKAEFEKVFGLSWEDALAKGLVFNAAEAAAKLGKDPLEISAAFDKLVRGKDQVKCGGGFYVGKVEDIYVVNGFYTRMRAKFTTSPASIHYYEVTWDPAALGWADFRAKVVGATNPAEAAGTSIRNAIFRQWKELGLPQEPDTGDNGVHASASPFEGLAERANWLGQEVARDPFGQALLDGGMAQATLQAWFGDCEVLVDGKKQSVFDTLEDLNAADCLAKAKVMASA